LKRIRFAAIVVYALVFALLVSAEAAVRAQLLIAQGQLADADLEAPQQLHELSIRDPLRPLDMPAAAKRFRQ
jgi:hypothetical protein